MSTADPKPAIDTTSTVVVTLPTLPRDGTRDAPRSYHLRGADPERVRTVVVIAEDHRGVSKWYLAPGESFRFEPVCVGVDPADDRNRLYAWDGERVARGGDR